MKESITLKDVFTITDGPQTASGGQARDRWTKVGIGFVNRDNSINIVLDALPVNGRLQIRDRDQKTSTSTSTTTSNAARRAA